MKEKRMLTPLCPSESALSWIVLSLTPLCPSESALSWIVLSLTPLCPSESALSWIVLSLTRRCLNSALFEDCAKSNIVSHIVHRYSIFWSKLTAFTINAPTVEPMKLRTVQTTLRIFVYPLTQRSSRRRLLYCDL